MTKSIELTPKQWARLSERLSQEYPPSVMMIRGAMKLKLGFVTRTHRWVEQVEWKHGLKDKQFTAIMLDFYSGKKCTWFIMKYGEYLDE